MSADRYLPQANPAAAYRAQRAEIDAAVSRVLAGGRYILGPEVAAFEAEFAGYLGVKHAIGVASGTDAIELALRACDIGPGQAVIAPSHTAVATVAAIERAGARPVLLDVHAATFTLDPARVEDLLNRGANLDGHRLAAIIPVHLYGHPADMHSLLAIAGRHGLRVIEDCAQSHGARLGGQLTGTFGDLAAFSFYPTKNLGAFGDGGLVATDDSAVADRLKGLREYGWQQRSVSVFPGGVNSRLDELQAAILRVMLPRLEAGNNRRREIARKYTAALGKLEIACPKSAASVDHAYHQFVIRASDRDSLRAFLAQTGVGTAIHYPVPVHRQPAYRDRGFTCGDLSVTENLCGQIVSLPIYPQLTDADVDRVIAAIGQWKSEPTAAKGSSP